MEILTNDYQYAMFTAFFILIIGCALGAVVAFEQPKMMESAQHIYGQSIVNNTYSHVEEQVIHETLPIWVGVGLFVIILLLNNLFLATLVVFLPRYIDGWLGVLSVSYLLFSLGFIPGMLFTRVASAIGISYSIVAFVPHGVFEFAGVIIAGGLGYYYLMKYNTEDKTELKKKLNKTYLHVVVPLILLASMIEVFITPFVEAMILIGL
jgi:uncharacterized membrane protein SpoIIM required for sporulation